MKSINFLPWHFVVKYPQTGHADAVGIAVGIAVVMNIKFCLTMND